MVHEYGMGTTIRAHQVPGDDFTVSEALRQIRDEEVQALAEEAYRGAHRLLTDHRDLLDEIASRLLVNEVMEYEEMQRIMSGRRDREAEAADWRREEMPAGASLGVLAAKRREHRDERR
jgi:cell division protease FtsH